MSDDLDHLKSLMDRATPEPDAQRRAANLKLAQQNFKALQRGRGMSGAKPFRRFWQSAVAMLQGSAAKAALMASVALVAGGLFLAAPPRVDHTIPQTAVAQLTAAAPMAAAPMAAAEDTSLAARHAPDASGSFVATFDAVRTALSQGVLPPADAVDIGALVNAFGYDLPVPDGPAVTVFETPWNPQTLLVLIALRTPALAQMSRVDALQVEFEPATVKISTAMGKKTHISADELRHDETRIFLYEVTPESEAVAPEDVRLQASGRSGDVLHSFEVPVIDGGAPGPEMQFAAAVAAFGMLLRDPGALGDWRYADVIALAEAGVGPDPSGRRAEVIALMRVASDLSR